jgi:ribulose-phosphate 3-epimerase
MPVICPAILAAGKDEYHQQMEKVASFAERIQIDLTDGEFASHKTIGPQDAWWPVGIQADFHLMYRRPDKAVEVLLEHKPNMIILHAEAEGNFLAFAQRFRRLGIKIGLALLPSTSVGTVAPALNHLDHVLIFSGSLGEYGGHANLDLLNKVHELKQHNPKLEIGWDGGVNTHNISQLASGGIDVFNVGGFLQESPDPERDYNALKRIAEETGTT